MNHEELTEIINENFDYIGWEDILADEEYIVAEASIPISAREAYELWLRMVQRRLDIDKTLCAPTVEQLTTLAPDDAPITMPTSRVDNSYIVGVSRSEVNRRRLNLNRSRRA